jgi:hypothetical protein
MRGKMEVRDEHSVERVIPVSSADFGNWILEPESKKMKK